MAFTQASEKTALHCLTVHDWKLDVAVDNYFQLPERYSRDTKPTLDRRKIEQMFNKYKGCYCTIWYDIIIRDVKRISISRLSNFFYRLRFP